MELNRQIKILKFCAILEDIPSRWIKPIKLYQTFVLFVSIYTTIMLLTFGIRNFTNVLEVAESVGPLVISSFTFIKYTFLLTHSEEIYGMIDEIKKLNRMWKNTNFYAEIEKFNKLENRILHLMEGLGFGSLMGYILPPMINYIYTSFVVNDPSYDMPFKTDYFYDISKYRAYEVTFFIQASLCLYGTLLHVGVDTLFFGICMNICAQLRIIRLTINERKLKDTVAHHNQILNIVASFNKAFKTILFGEYAVISVLLGVNGFLIVMSNDIFVITVSLVLGMATIIELMIYSYGGQKIMDCNKEICDECYEIDKDYLIVMLRTKHQLRLYSMMYDANLSTVTLIMNRVMAMITLLQSFASNPLV